MLIFMTQYEKVERYLTTEVPGLESDLSFCLPVIHLLEYEVIDIHSYCRYSVTYKPSYGADSK